MTIHVTLVHAPRPREWVELALQLPAGSVLSQALSTAETAQLGWLAEDDAPAIPGMVLQDRLNRSGLQASIWGVRAELGQVLLDGDRIELCRGLRVDPKVARRERFSRQGARATGLFAGKRAGAKDGY